MSEIRKGDFLIYCSYRGYICTGRYPSCHVVAVWCVRVICFSHVLLSHYSAVCNSISYSIRVTLFLNSPNRDIFFFFLFQNPPHPTKNPSSPFEIHVSRSVSYWSQLRNVSPDQDRIYPVPDIVLFYVQDRYYHWDAMCDWLLSVRVCHVSVCLWLSMCVSVSCVCVIVCLCLCLCLCLCVCRVGSCGYSKSRERNGGGWYDRIHIILSWSGLRRSGVHDQVYSIS